MKGWLDKYNDGGPVQENYNDNTTSYPPGFVGMGYNTQGRNYSPAWGGQFAMGGSLPGSVGFTYARTNSPAPSEGPYAKKTLPSAQNGQEMSFYQHGLDWTPRNISRNGDDIPKNQNAQYVLPRYNMPRPGSESTVLPNKVTEADLRQMSINRQREAQGQIKKAAPKRSATSKALAIAANPMTALKYKVKGQDIPENFERGERNALDYALDPINPGGIAEAVTAIPGNLSRGEFLQTGLNLLSVIPTASEFVKNPLVKNAARAARDIPRAESIKEAVGRVVGIPLKKDIPRMATNDVKALRQVQEIGRLRATNSPMSEQMRYGLENNLPEEHFQKVFGKSREEAQSLLNTGFAEQEAARSAGIRGRINLERSVRSPRRDEIVREYIQSLPESERDNVARELLDEETVSDVARDIYTSGPITGIDRSNRVRDIISSLGISLDDLVTSSTDDQLADFARRNNLTENEILDTYLELGETVNTRSVDPVTEIRSDRVQDALDALEGLRRNTQSRGRIIIPGQERPRETMFQALGRDWNNYVDRKQPTSQIINNKLENFINKNIQNYPYYSGRVQEKVPSLSLSGSGNLKNVSKKVNFAPEGIKSGDVFTGSTNTSHSSYLPQLKQVFKYTKGDPQFLGYQPMNQLGFLSGYGYEGGDIAKYLNSEIDEQIRRGVIPKDISRPFQRGEHVMLPHYGVKQNKQGGVVKDNMGYWNPDNWGKVVEIDSPNITMRDVYEPLEGISKQTGERKVMLPGKDYTFANTKQVIEKPLNKKSTGGWLDKYN
jgi:hypothetical protein